MRSSDANLKLRTDMYGPTRTKSPFLHVLAIPAAAVLLIFAGGCDSLGLRGDHAAFTTEVSYETLSSGHVKTEQLDSGQYSDIKDGTRKILRDEEEYRSFWERLHADRSSTPDRPSVNFERQVVVAVVLGERPSGGYAVTIDGVRTTAGGERIQVRFTETTPGEGCVVTAVLTSPYVLATVEHDGDFTFSGSEETRSCQ